MLLVFLFAGALAVQSASPGEADPLYANRTDLASARRAADLWATALGRNPNDYESAWKLARADYWLGGHAPEKERAAFFEDGVTRASAAAAREPNRPEAHFWTAVNMGGLAEMSARAGLKYRKPIKEALEMVLRIDPSFLQGSADRVLGRWYAQVPRLLGGNKKTAEAHLRASLTYNSHSTSSHFFLAELLRDTGRREEARAEAQRVLDAPLDPGWEPENQEFKDKARALLAALSR